MSNHNLWEFVREQRERKNKDKIYHSFKFEPTTTPIARENSIPSRQNRTIHNTNPVDFNGVMGDIEGLLNHPDLEQKRLLQQEIKIALQNDSDYFIKLVAKFRELKVGSSFSEFLNQEIQALLQQSKNRQSQVLEGINRMGMHYYDDRDITNVPRDQREYQFSQYQKVLYAEKVMSVFKGKESLFEDPFDLGLEPSVKVYRPDHFDHTVFAQSEVTLQLTDTAKNEGNDNSFLDFVKRL
jgi:hypothetical protein